MMVNLLKNVLKFVERQHEILKELNGVTLDLQKDFDDVCQQIKKSILGKEVTSTNLVKVKDYPNEEHDNLRNDDKSSTISNSTNSFNTLYVFSTHTSQYHQSSIISDKKFLLGPSPEVCCHDKYKSRPCLSSKLCKASKESDILHKDKDNLLKSCTDHNGNDSQSPIKTCTTNLISDKHDSDVAATLPLDIELDHSSSELSKLISTENFLKYEPDKGHMCDVCKIRFCTIFKLNEHRFFRHGIKNTPIKCDKSFNTTPVLGNDRPIHNDKDKEYYICEICGKTLTRLRSVNLHLRTHFDERPFSCTKCEKRFTDAHTLKNHEICHDEKKFQCETCGKNFATKYYLKSHCLVHSEIALRQFECTICGKKFQFNSGLKVHTRIHTGEKPHKCAICDKTFTHSTSLKVHMLKHDNRRDFECSFCKKKFPTNSLKNKHVKASHGEKRIACEICGKKFTTNEKLKQHLICHSEAKPFQCDICGKEFLRLQHLKRHKSSHTKSN